MRVVVCPQQGSRARGASSASGLPRGAASSDEQDTQKRAANKEEDIDDDEEEGAIENVGRTRGIAFLEAHPDVEVEDHDEGDNGASKGHEEIL